MGSVRSIVCARFFNRNCFVVKCNFGVTIVLQKAKVVHFKRGILSLRACQYTGVSQFQSIMPPQLQS